MVVKNMHIKPSCTLQAPFGANKTSCKKQIITCKVQRFQVIFISRSGVSGENNDALKALEKRCNDIRPKFFF